jgi:phosphocarrier protein
MREFDYVVTDEVGIHARPAGMLVKEAKKYKSRILLLKDGKSAEATRLMGIMALGVKCGQTVTVQIIGEDEDEAYEGIKAFFQANL